MIDISDFKWSFSRLNSFHGCKLAWYKTYILKEKGVNNSFAEYGTLMHETLEKFCLGELEVYELSTYFRQQFDNKSWDFPYNSYVDLYSSYRKQGVDYLNCFENFQGNILGVEKELNFIIGGYQFTGYIDLVLQDNNGDIIILDHKSKSEFKSIQEKREYTRQLYLYAIQIFNEYGKYPTKFMFNMFRKQNIIVIPFNMSDLEETKTWMLNTIDVISKEEKFEASPDEFMCNYLCNHRNSCNIRNEV